jgi:hypothetical protein
VGEILKETVKIPLIQPQIKTFYLNSLIDNNSKVWLYMDKLIKKLQDQPIINFQMINKFLRQRNMFKNLTIKLFKITEIFKIYNISNNRFNKFNRLKY